MRDNEHILLEEAYDDVEHSNIDLFDDYDKLPPHIKDIIEKYSECDNDYKTCERFIAELKENGYTADYGLDAIPFDLKKIQN